MKTFKLFVESVYDPASGKWISERPRNTKRLKFQIGDYVKIKQQVKYDHTIHQIIDIGDWRNCYGIDFGGKIGIMHFSATDLIESSELEYNAQKYNL